MLHFKKSDTINYLYLIFQNEAFVSCVFNFYVVRFLVMKHLYLN